MRKAAAILTPTRQTSGLLRFMALALTAVVVAVAEGCGSGSGVNSTTGSPTPSSSSPSTPATTSTSPQPPSSTLPPTSTQPTTSKSQTPTATTNAASVAITQPITGSVSITADVTVSVSVSGLNLVDKAGQANAPGEGHLIYYLDVTVPTQTGLPALTSTGSYATATSLSYQWQNLPDGVHMLSVQVVNNDNTPLNPPAVATVSVSVFTG